MTSHERARALRRRDAVARSRDRRLTSGMTLDEARVYRWFMARWGRP